MVSVAVSVSNAALQCAGDSQGGQRGGQKSMIAVDEVVLSQGFRYKGAREDDHEGAH